MKTIIIILIAIILTGCLCGKHTGAIVVNKSQGEKYKVLEEKKKHLHTFNYIVLKEKNGSTTIKKMSKFRLGFYKLNEPICHGKRKN